MLYINIIPTSYYTVLFCNFFLKNLKKENFKKSSNSNNIMIILKI